MCSSDLFPSHDTWGVGIFYLEDDPEVLELSADDGENSQETSLSVKIRKVGDKYLVEEVDEYGMVDDNLTEFLLEKLVEGTELTKQEMDAVYKAFKKLKF